MIIDSDLSYSESLRGIGPDFPQDILQNLTPLYVRYWSYDHLLHLGQVIIHKSLVADLLDFFSFVEMTRFPVYSVVPISRYGWDVDRSTQSNNSSAFNYQPDRDRVYLSSSAQGRSFSLNPRFNPRMKDGVVVSPPGSNYDPDYRGTLHANHSVVLYLKGKGWFWGGDWTREPDYGYFSK